MNIKEIKKEALLARICATRQIMGEDAAQAAAESINQLLKEKEEINILFAAAPHKTSFWPPCRSMLFLEPHPCLAHGRVHRSASGCASTLRELSQRTHICRTSFKSIHYLYIEGASPENICTHYEEVLQKHPIDIVFMGIGENGHIAFNDPHVALFDDPQQVKVVLLDEVCRTQQVHDGCFSSLEKVPQQAVTITIPVMMKATRIFCIVPGKPKANAVKETLYGPVSTTCPASILRTHPHATLYCDRDSASLLSI